MLKVRQIFKKLIESCLFKRNAGPEREKRENFVVCQIRLIAGEEENKT